MHPEQEAFVAQLRDNPEDHATRLVYADWLDDHDQPEEADRMRKWRSAREWLARFASSHDQTLQGVVAIGDGYDPKAVGQRDYGDTGLYERLGEPDVQREFWRCWSVYTGKAEPPQDPDYPDDRNPFTCSC